MKFCNAMQIRPKIDFTKNLQKISKHNCENSNVKFNPKMIFYNLEKINKYFFLTKIRYFLTY